ncbi:hypothetical protein E2562_013425 [Oryza meyeriana var. granulata]|uniref:Uncharacterized protein n=1 Tax=Oryza meyeriana var. granulata TaxID=110450 RepID=A0A6G1EA74_9ORYZ|nr:hypothetical protein E2562_013425 [Oryza meyeriana var. granulata]
MSGTPQKPDVAAERIVPNTGAVGEGHAWCRLALEEAESSGNEHVVLKTLKTESCRSWQASKAGSSWLQENKIAKIQAVEAAAAFVAIVDCSSSGLTEQQRLAALDSTELGLLLLALLCRWQSLIGNERLRDWVARSGGVLIGV